MGQSAAEQVAEPPSSASGEALPDVLASAPLAGPADGQADDLLSQLAGAEIDRMLAEADVEPALPAPPPAPVEVPAAAAAPVEPPAPAPPVAVTPPATAVPPPPVDLDQVLSAAAEPSAVDADTVPLDELAADVRPSVIVRMLRVVSTPLDAWPDGVREAIGKVAVVTLCNAVAVMAYVALFRHHG